MNASLIERLLSALADFDADAVDHINNESERADLWGDIDLPVALVRQAADALAKSDERIASIDAFAQKYKRHMHNAEARAEAAERELAKMREALEPFRNAAAAIDDQWSDEYPMMGTREFSDKAVVVTVGDLRRARAALEGEG